MMAHWRGIAGAAAAILLVWANWDYLREVRNKAAAPRLASWSIWTAATLIGAIGAAEAGQWTTALFSLAATASSASVLALGWRLGDRNLSWLDGIAIVIGSTGLLTLAAAIAWPGSIPLTAAIGISVATDACAFLPTYANARDGREAPRPYVIYTVAAALALAAADFSQPAGLIFPSYLVAASGVAAWVATAGKARAAARSCLR